ncbi:exodeoxyribonuclease VII small subunit [Pediococcus argentinicus]|uniref:exodeoxyribonuclease VII small subunit n=1 Tax=Pediococcus argentinicus TaxID=480391 RepID=UPI00338E1720
MANKKTFEDNLKELEQIVNNLEKGDVPLEEALTEFQKGVQLSGELQDTLKNAEKTLTKVMDEDGKESDFDLKDQSTEKND